MKVITPADTGISTESFTELLGLWRNLPHVLQNFDDKIWIAGGAVRRSIEGLPLDTDVDLFFSSRAIFAEWLAAMMLYPGSVITVEADHMVQFDFALANKVLKVQGVRRAFFPTVEALLADFDFTICQFAYDGHFFYVGDNALEHLRDRKLVVANPHTPVATFRRFGKYAGQGFHASDVTYADFLRSVVLHPENIDKPLISSESATVPAEAWQEPRTPLVEPLYVTKTERHGDAA